jgi:20S proteasome alpha/beta subunit
MTPRKGKPWPWNTIPRPADWGVGMTVCIAAHCFESGSSRECIICATDAMISTGEMSADHSARKIQVIGDGWYAMFAGNDISCLSPIADHVENVISKNNSSGRASRDTVVNAFVDAYKQQLKLRAESEVLTSIGYSLEEFKSNGLAQLGPDIFSRIFYDVESQVIDLTFLVAGFDRQENHHIFTVGSSGKVSYYSELGFWAIGSGQTQALGSLFNASRRPRFIGRAGALYRVCEAKFNAENALGVGPTTIVGIVDKDAARRFIFPNELEPLRPIWEKTRVVEVPPEAIKAATAMLSDPKPPEPSPSQPSKQK